VVPAPSHGPWAAPVSSVEAITTPKEVCRRAGALRARSSGRYRFTGTCVLAILLDPVALIVLLVLVLDGAPSHAVGAVLLTVLIFGGVEGLLVDLLGSLGEVVLDAVWQLRYLLVRYRTPRI
jgi:hypothetical protein